LVYQLVHRLELSESRTGFTSLFSYPSIPYNMIRFTQQMFQSMLLNQP